MTDINPNSRAIFVDQRGRLTKYGQEIIRDIYQTLNLVGGSSIFDDLQADTPIDNTKSLKRRISELEENIPTPRPTDKSLVQRVEDLETQVNLSHKFKSILRRLDEIESQL